jgi:hypothetical protein
MVSFYSLPFMLAIVVGSGVAGLVVSLTGNYWNFLVFGPWLACVGAGLLYTLHEHSSNSKYIGYQVCTSPSITAKDH